MNYKGHEVNKLPSKPLVDAKILEVTHRASEYAKLHGNLPKLVSLVCSDDSAALSYVRSKKKMAERLGINFDVLDFSNLTSDEQLIDEIIKLNADDRCGGIIVEFPLRQGFSEVRVSDAVAPSKDVDGLCAQNLGALVQSNVDSSTVAPATPTSCILLAEQSTSLVGRKVVVLGRGRTVGKPLANMLVSKGATVTVCHSKTENLDEEIGKADVVFCAIGRPAFLKASSFKPGATVVDAGIGFIEGKISGDVDASSLEQTDLTITPVPGGVGPLTTITLFENFLYLIGKSYA